jgi:putative solute:sodium symporter small subunit
VNAHEKEVRSTIGFGIAYVLLGHTGLWFVMFGTNNASRILGLPIHYFIAISLGSLGVLVLSVFWCRYANRLEDEIEAENAATVARKEDVRQMAIGKAEGSA